MDLFSELYAAVQSDLTVDATSTLYPLATIKTAVNRSYRKAAGLFRWPQLEDSQETGSVINQEYYDYPDNWRPNTIWKLSVDGVDYGSPLPFKDYLYEKENSIPSGRQELWSNQWLRYFIYPTPTANGTSNIVVWGLKNITSLVADGDVTIFSNTLPECNEAIVLEAVAILKNKGDLIQPVMRSFVGGTMLLSIEAQNILRNAFGKIQEEQSKYQKTTPFFTVPDFFGRKNTVKDIIGDFK